MKSLQTPLIANRATRQLSALGQKQVDRFIRKAAEIQGTHRYNREFWPVRDQVTAMIKSLIFDHNVTKEQLSELQKHTKVINGKLQLPAISLPG